MYESNQFCYVIIAIVACLKTIHCIDIDQIPYSKIIFILPILMLWVYPIYSLEKSNFSFLIKTLMTMSLVYILRIILFYI